MEGAFFSPYLLDVDDRFFILHGCDFRLHQRDGSGIVPMAFRQFQFLPVCLCDIAVGKYRIRECLPQTLLQDVHKRGISQTPGKLFLILHPLVKDASGQMVFCGMALTAYRSHVLWIIRCSPAPVKDMMHMKLPAFLFTHPAGIPVPGKDIGAHIFIVILRSFLVQLPVDPRILNPGRVKTAQFDGKPVSFREKVQEFPDPLDMMVRFGLQGWRQPPCLSFGSERVLLFLPVPSFPVCLLIVGTLCLWLPLRVPVPGLPIPSPSP